MKNAFFFLLALLATTAVFAQSSATRARAKALVSQMTPEEKARLVTGMGFKFPAPAGQQQKDTGHVAVVIEGFKLPPADPEAATVAEKVPGAAGRTHAIARLGIPSITVADGPAGVRISPIRNGDSSRTYFATAWPVATLLASSWDTALVKQVGLAFGSEVRDYGVDILLGPALNIHRNPLGGRNFEYYSEDPVVSGYITAAMVNGIQANGVGTSIKHFAANNQETNRNSVNTIAGERALREIYLKGFEIAVKKSQPWTVMSSYNLINGVYTSERPDLLTTILRKEWGFKGFVMTDWFGGKDAVAQVKAGNDLLMPGNPDQSAAIITAVKNGTLDSKQLDLDAERIIAVILQSPAARKYAYSNQPDLKKDAQVSRKAAGEGMVLLKNTDGALPLQKEKTIALFGNTSYDIIAGGTGSGDVNKAYTISLLEGLANAGYTVAKDLQDTYSQYIAAEKIKRPKPRFFFDPVPPIAEMTIPAEQWTKAAEQNDAAIITIGRNSGEGYDRKPDNDFTLSPAEAQLIQAAAAAFHAKHKKLVVVLNIGGVIETAGWRDAPDAILLAWQPGMEAGNAIADILSGKVNPSGKLATTFPLKYADVPSANNFPGRELVPADDKTAFSILQGRPAEVIYEEGIYVGYRYYTTFHVTPAYEFGYGLSYTSFRYSPIQLSAKNMDSAISITLTVTNTGRRAGKEVVQLYITAPNGLLDKPAEELKAFAKTKLLPPGQSQTLVFHLRPADLSSYDTVSASWVAAKGNYTVKIGASCSDIRQTAVFRQGKDIVTEKCSNALQPQVSIHELKPGK